MPTLLSIPYSRSGIPYRTFLFAAICMFYCTAAFSQHVLFKNYNVEHGLPSSEVYYVFTDSKGYIWFGTDGGVSRFDGSAFENFSTSNGLTDNAVFIIQEDYKGRIWFKEGAIFSYLEQGRIHPIPAMNSIRMGNEFTKSFYIDRHDTLWIGTSNGHYKIAHPYTEQDVQFVNKNDLEPFIKEIDGRGMIWGTYTLNFRKMPFVNLRVIRDKKPLFSTEIAASKVSYMFLTSLRQRNGDIIYANNLELIKISHDNKVIKKEMPHLVLGLYEDHENNIWVGMSKGVWCFPKGNFAAKPEIYLADIKIASISEDFEGGIWIGSTTEGVFYLKNRKIAYYDKNEGLPGANINSITHFGNRLILGTDNRSIGILENDRIRQLAPLGYSTNPLFTILMKHSDGTLWMFANNAIAVLDTSLRTKVRFNFQAKAVSEARDGAVWIGNADKILKISNTDYRVVKELKSFFRPMALLDDHSGRLWIGTTQGLFYYDGKEIKPYRPDIPLFREKISDIRISKNKQIWITTKGHGVIIIKPGGAFKQIVEENGLTSNFCKRVFIAGNGDAWISTNKGVSRIRFTNAGKLHIQNYTGLDGLLSDEVNDVQMHGDQVWIASNKGITTFNPADITPGIAPFIYVTGLSASGKPQPADSSFRLDHESNYLIINYKGISYKDFGKVKYKYKMDGIDTAWFYTFNTSVQYPSLSPGQYTFSLYAINSDGVESVEPARLSFTITPPFWNTWWFICGCLSAASLILFTFFRYRIRTVTEREQIKRKAMQNQLKALQARMNPHFVFNSLNAVLRFIQENDTVNSQRFLSRFARLVRHVLDHSDSSSIGLREELDALALYLELESTRLKGKFEYEIQVGETVVPSAIKIPSMIIQPYVENAIWHAFNGHQGMGRILIRLDIQNHVLTCVVEDNGIGRKRSLQNKSPYKIGKSYGMQVTRERLEIINQLNKSKMAVNIIDLEDQDDKAAGTRVELFIPVNE